MDPPNQEIHVALALMSSLQPFWKKGGQPEQHRSAYTDTPKNQLKDWVVVSSIFYFNPYLGKWSNLTNIFSNGLNHQLEDNCLCWAFASHQWYDPSLGFEIWQNLTENFKAATVNPRTKGEPPDSDHIAISQPDSGGDTFDAQLFNKNSWHNMLMW